jgi:hypothetical protein
VDELNEPLTSFHCINTPKSGALGLQAPDFFTCGWA